MNTTRTVLVNKNGGYYSSGCRFTEERWVEILDIFYNLTFQIGDRDCSPTELAEAARISWGSAKKAVIYGEIGLIPPGRKCGHGKRGVGSLLEMEMHHHFYIYELYLRNPSRPLLSYCDKLEKKYGKKVSEMTIHRWFRNIGPFKGSLRLTSRFPPAKDSWETQHLLQQYLSFVGPLDHRGLVFMDEKPMKGIDIYKHVRKDPFTDHTPNLTCDANSKNRYNVLAAVSLKKEAPICTRVVEEVGDSILFSEFVAAAMEEGVLVRGDILIIDNCSIHYKSENEHLQEILLMEHGILMIPLPPYYCELNPTELVFRALLMRLKAIRCRSSSPIDFLSEVRKVLSQISYQAVKSFYKECGYYRRN